MHKDILRLREWRPQYGGWVGLSESGLGVCYLNNGEIWINDCPSRFKPLIYRRYVDDCFAIFQDRSHAHKFLHYFK